MPHFVADVTLTRTYRVMVEAIDRDDAIAILGRLDVATLDKASLGIPTEADSVLSQTPVCHNSSSSVGVVTIASRDDDLLK